jgi:hypothetical protein
MAEAVSCQPFTVVLWLKRLVASLSQLCHSRSYLLPAFNRCAMVEVVSGRPSTAVLYLKLLFGIFERCAMTEVVSCQLSTYVQWLKRLVAGISLPCHGTIS